jgi:hypothetical protein
MSSCTCNTIDDTVYVAATRGDTVAFDVTLYGPTDEPLDLTGWTWLSEVRDGTKTLVATFVVTPGAVGVVTLSLDAATTAPLLGDYVFDIQATDDQATVKTLVHGKLRIREDVTA